MSRKRPASQLDESEQWGESDREEQLPAGKANENSDQSAPSAPLSLAQRMYTDGLHSIFKFLSLPDLQPALRSCRSWRDAAYKEKSRHRHCVLRWRGVPSLVASPLRHHVSAYGMNSMFALSFPLASVPLLAQLPQLTALALKLDVSDIDQQLETRSQVPPAAAAAQAATASQSNAEDSQSAAAAAGEMIVARVAAELAPSWPQRLQQLVLLFHDSMTDLSSGPSSAVQLLVSAVTALPPTLTHLKIDAGPGAHSPIDLGPLLLRLTRLSRLILGGSLAFSKTHADHIKQMETLQYLAIFSRDWTVQHLQWLCALPHRGLQRLEEVNLGSATLSSPHLIALAQLPALTRLAPNAIDPTALPMLDRFPSLRVLHLRSGSEREVVESVDAQLLLRPLRTIGARLTELSLDQFSVASEEQSTALFSLLPALQTLSLSRVRLPSLLGLRPLTQLHSLTLEWCASLLPENLLELQHVPSLRKLTVRFGSHELEAVRAKVLRAKEVCSSPLLRHFTATIP